MGTVQLRTVEPSSASARTDQPSARAWCARLPEYDRVEVTPDLLAAVDALPPPAHHVVLAGWRRAASAGLCERAILRTIVDVVVAAQHDVALAPHVELPASA
jgi:hypothetical protein